MNDSSPRTIYAVSGLAEVLRALVENALPRVWVEGEISNFSRPASGHWYFTLKDEQAQIRSAMFRNANYLVRPQPKNGDRVLVRASVSFYTARGDLQLICEHLEPAGEGALLRAFEDLKRRLSAEGLFDSALKRPLPRLPRRLGVITSATGAAVQDVLTALSRRFPLLTVGLWPVPVQGAAAAPAIVKALGGLPARMAVDAILLVRGGGSLEDLWSFNEEPVARAIRACSVPVVTGVGHEIDFTIADFAADLRAPTPTAAAELASPDGGEFRRGLTASRAALLRAMRARTTTLAGRLAQHIQRLAQQHPNRVVFQRAQRLDEQDLRLREALTHALLSRRDRLRRAVERLHARAPSERLGHGRALVSHLQQRLRRAALSGLGLHGERWERRHALLQSLSPQTVLNRGYAIALAESGQVIRDAEAVDSRARIELVLARGRMRAYRAD
ncbi:MAG: exodeoxyribonuclease VII large subunit [Panacagrimonas sp.]